MANLKLWKQKFIFVNGNEAAAEAGKDINFHVMGYFPITPSTAIAETMDEMYANGKHQTKLIPGDGEHGAAGICYGATLGNARVMNATSANGLLYAIEQLPVQSGTRMPLVLNVVNRTVSGPLDIKCDHSDAYTTLSMGWLQLWARDPQMVYDFNIIAVKLMESEGVQLPVMVCSDGFTTSHQKRRISVIDFPSNDDGIIQDRKMLYDWIGATPPPRLNALNPKKPLTMGPYMNDPDLINNKYQLMLAHKKAYEILPRLFEEFKQLSGREYKLVDTYKTEDAEVVLVVLNSPYTTIKQVVDELREKGQKVGVVQPNTLRPFPKKEIQDILRNVKCAVILDRADNPGGWGSNLAFEIKSSLFDDKTNKTGIVLNRIYGLGGREFYIHDAFDLFEAGFKAIKDSSSVKDYDFIGVETGKTDYKPNTNIVTPLEWKDLDNGIEVTETEENGVKKLEVKGVNKRRLATFPKRMVSGHGACTGCGIGVNINLLNKGLKGHVVYLFATGCAMVVSTGYPSTAFRTTYVHNLFQSGAPTLSGLLEAFNERRRRGEIDIPENETITFVMVTGDGGNDIGMGATVGTANRNHGLIIMEYDNGGYMNTGAQLSYASPRHAMTSTSHVGPFEVGKSSFHKDSPMIMAGTHIPYIATVAESNDLDFLKKVAKAQYVAQKYGMAYIKTMSACPLNWRDTPRYEASVVEAAVKCCYHPLYEIEFGHLHITVDPEKKGEKIPVTEWAGKMGRLKHLTNPKYKNLADEFQVEVDRRWARLKAMDGNPVL